MPTDKKEKYLKAIFLDRDGTINVDVGYNYKISDFAFEKYAAQGLKILQKNNFSFFIVTNQSGIGRGYYTEKDYADFNNHVVKQLEKNGIQITKTFFCPFHPTAGIGKYKQDSPLRKPNCGMLEQAQKEFSIDKNQSWMIGDKWSDIKTGEKFGIKTILLKTGKGGCDNEHKTQTTYVADNFIDAAKFIINYKYDDEQKD